MACLTQQMGLHFESMHGVAAFFVFWSCAASSSKLTCGKEELRRQDCRLTMDTYNLRLLKDTVAWSDGTWHTVDDLPLKGEGLSWEKARFEFLNGWPILQIWIWDAGSGENKVQSLHWYVADAEKRKFTVLAEGIVRKRRPHKVASVGDGLSKTPASPPPSFTYDRTVPHALRGLKNGSLEWTLDRDKKIIGRVQNGI